VTALVRPGATAPPGTIPLVHDLRLPFAPETPTDVECVVHLAHHPHIGFPENATALHRLNTSSTQELLEVARRAGAARFVYASSGTVYGYADHPLEEADPPRATDFYALTKLQAEALLQTYTPFFEAVVLRPFFPYGHGQRDRLIPRLAERIERGDPIDLRPGARPHVNPVFVDDAVDAIVAAAEGRSPSLLNLAGPDIVSIRELALAIGRAISREPMFVELAEPLDGDLVASSYHLREVLGRSLVTLEDGLAAALVSAPTRTAQTPS
jgi:nucleoside-diphosphate-sugar epimerase